MSLRYKNALKISTFQLMTRKGTRSSSEDFFWEMNCLFMDDSFPLKETCPVIYEEVKKGIIKKITVIASLSVLPP